MRKILFRGKRVDTGEWIYGDLHNVYLKKHGVIMISPSEDEVYKVVPETVGQYTGLTDKNGNEIFEGDICKFRDWDKGDMCYVGQIKFECCQYVITGGPNKECPSIFYFPLSRIKSENIEIIGNIYDTKKGE